MSKKYEWRYWSLKVNLLTFFNIFATGIFWRCKNSLSLFKSIEIYFKLYVLEVPCYLNPTNHATISCIQTHNKIQPVARIAYFQHVAIDFGMFMYGHVFDCVVVVYFKMSLILTSSAGPIFGKFDFLNFPKKNFLTRFPKKALIKRIQLTHCWYTCASLWTYMHKVNWFQHAASTEIEIYFRDWNHSFPIQYCVRCYTTELHKISINSSQLRMSHLRVISKINLYLKFNNLFKRKNYMTFSF